MLVPGQAAEGAGEPQRSAQCSEDVPGMASVSEAGSYPVAAGTSLNWEGWGEFCRAF